MEGGQAPGPAWLLDTIAVSGNDYTTRWIEMVTMIVILLARGHGLLYVSVRTRRDLICYYFILIVSIFGTLVVLRCFSV